MNCVNRQRAFEVFLLFLSLLVVGCSKEPVIEIAHGVLTTGESYRLVYERSQLPFDDHGSLWLFVSGKGGSIVKQQLERGYDMSVDVEASLRESSPGTLVIAEKRMRKGWVFEQVSGEVRTIDFEAALELLKRNGLLDSGLQPE